MYWWNSNTLVANYVTNYLVQIWPQSDLQRRRIWLVLSRQPNKSLHLKNENSIGGKHSKLRLTRLTAANDAGENLCLFVIGQSKKPRCFKHTKHLLCRYRSQKKSWMDGILYKDWVREVDRRFTKEGRNIALLVDNCPAYPSIDRLPRIYWMY